MLQHSYFLIALVAWDTPQLLRAKKIFFIPRIYKGFAKDCTKGEKFHLSTHEVTSNILKLTDLIKRCGEGVSNRPSLDGAACQIT